ncbi:MULTISPECIES: ROK family protein [unclassified Breznakia]|uniref:ROK family protein n=1 Tax=unclassified Breznakia TaxID=2623764 RepID=UPI002472F37D|nr:MULTISPECIES: ROK family protein [unclassified Breznakia]MDH6368132.1 putative NBD/HSP70 family sugar kinase [Breznakia sp. PH1-1]MDH6405221.1 putative NBD/HSP70 family sugar kinase [Breznakia sp. PF1-11]MDH6412926.1 putative NBD/HSP70 family sugar kinase [Breznakia sp. PFB1-11]MDH6415288.1 putative NBD/HSP70 family sugar kinase [Breznakia sp. PFB1-14]MDH6417606.1 putative NBD/HSP70 family sugar kinase [Breznakia sp. PFB1-4]
MNVLAIDIGGTFVKYGLVDDNNQLVHTWKKETKACKSADEFYDDICSGLDCEYDLVGISAPGVLSDDGVVTTKAGGNAIIMYQTNVTNEIEKRLQKPVATINDAKAAGYCESQIGNGKGAKSSAYFIIGTGIGGCLCDDRGVITGFDGAAGELSNLPVGINEKTNEIEVLVEHAGVPGLIQKYNALANEDVKYGKDVSEQFIAKNPYAIQAVEWWCANITLGLHAINVVYNPEVICIGGGISEASWFLDTLLDVYNTKVSFHFKSAFHPTITTCKFHNDANLLGAAIYTKNQNIEK